MRKKSLVVLLAVLMVLSVAIAGCGGQQTQDQSAKPAETKKDVVIRYNLGAQPETIDPALNSAVDGATVILHTFEGLVNLDEHQQPVPGVAEKWDVSDDGLVWTFHLRDNAKWTDGQPVTAKDFDYAWKRALNPDTASEYAYQLYYIKNGEDYNTGKNGVTADDLGIKVIDDHTIEVTLAAPTPYILQIFAFPTLFPVRQDTVEANGDKWAQSPDTYIGNGAFKVTEMAYQDHITMVKNDNYWNKDAIKPDKLIFTEVVDESTMLASYENGEMDVIDSMPNADIERLKNDPNSGFVLGANLGTYYVDFNNQKAPFNNPLVRKAFSLAIDRKSLVENVTKAGQIPADAFVGPGFPDADPTKEFHDVQGAFYDGSKANVEEAKKALADAGYPDGKGFPKVTYLYNEGQGHQDIAQALQEMWKQNLGVQVELSSQEWQVFQETRRRGEYDIARDGWLGDYTDPMTMLDLFISNSGNNNLQYKSKEYDALISKAKSTNNEADRMQAMHDAQQLLLGTDWACAPLYFYTDPYCVKPGLKGMIADPLGFKRFHYAYWENQ